MGLRQATCKRIELPVEHKKIALKDNAAPVLLPSGDPVNRPGCDRPQKAALDGALLEPVNRRRRLDDSA